MYEYAQATYEALRLLRSLYWIMTEIMDALKEAEGKATSGLRFHLILVGKRVEIIRDHLRLALEEAGISPGDRISEESLLRAAGSISIETLEKIKGVLKKLVEECGSEGKIDVHHLASRLLEFADIASIAASIMKMCSSSLEKTRDRHAWRVHSILEAVSRDLELIAHMHRQLASDPEMLAEDLEP